jgi:hypothetical protein
MKIIQSLPVIAISRDPADGRKDIVLAAFECDGHHKKALLPAITDGEPESAARVVSH